MAPAFPSEITVDWLLAHAALISLAASRAAGLAWTAPVLAAPGLGPRFRLLIALALTPVVVPVVLSAEGGAGFRGASAGAVGWACVVEGLVGAALGWTAALVIAGARQAGEVVGAQAGLSAAALFDPEAGGEMTALGHLYGLIALGVFLALDGPLALVRALAESFLVFPAGSGLTADFAGPSVESVSFAFGKVGEALAMALRAAAPAALALAAAGLALGLLGRASPSLQRAAMLMPLRTLLGLVIVGLALTTLAATLSIAWEGWPGASLGSFGVVGGG